MGWHTPQKGHRLPLCQAGSRERFSSTAFPLHLRPAWRAGRPWDRPGPGGPGEPPRAPRWAGPALPSPSAPLLLRSSPPELPSCAPLLPHGAGRCRAAPRCKYLSVAEEHPAACSEPIWLCSMSAPCASQHMECSVQSVENNTSSGGCS